MSFTLERIQALAARQEIRISDHGYDELSADGLTVRDVLDGLANAIVVEDYPTYGKGPCVLVLQRDSTGGPMHGCLGDSCWPYLASCPDHSVSAGSRTGIPTFNGDADE